MRKKNLRTIQKLHEQGENIANEVLQIAKNHVRAIVMDQDGTIKGGDDPKYQGANVVELLQKIARHQKTPVIITASGASALKSFESMSNFYNQEKIFTATYIGIGNGTALYRYDASGKIEVYNFGLTIKEEKSIIAVWQEVYKTLGIKASDLHTKGIETFKKFMNVNWDGYIPKKYIELFRKYGGQCFTEPIKVTVVFPDWNEERQRELVKLMQELLDQNLGKNSFIAKRGDNTYLHITHSFHVDPKLFALQKVMKELHLKDRDVAVFGDLPLDNDRGILIEGNLPFTFTNHEFVGYDVNKPPYVLPGCSISAVGSVYKAIDYLLS